jgi:hypothetical protein
MIASKELLVSVAQQAGMSIPANLEVFDTYQFPHWTIFWRLQTDRPFMDWREPLRNAEIINQIPFDKLIHMNWEDFEEAGVTGI